MTRLKVLFGCALVSAFFPFVASGLMSTSTCPTFSGVLSRGMTDAQTGGKITALQEYLASYVSTSTNNQLITGYFGTITEAHVRVLQSQLGIDVSGIVSPSMLEALRAGCSGTTTAPVPSAAFDQSPMVSLLAAPTITGTASSSVSFGLKITSADGSIVYSIDRVPVNNTTWSTTVNPAIPGGRYEMSLVGSTTVLATSSLQIGPQTLPSVTLDDAPFPTSDPTDGKLLRFMIRAGAGGPVGIGQFAFQIATTSADVLGASLSVYSDSTYSEPAASSNPVNAQPVDPSPGTFFIIPDSPLEIPAGHTYFFELDAVVAPTDASYGVTTTLLGDSERPVIESLDQLTGSGDHFIWTPNTFGTSNSTSTDWTNASIIPGLPESGLRRLRMYTPPPAPPTCTITTTVAGPQAVQTVTVDWQSTDATYAMWNTGERDVANGTKDVKTVALPRIFGLTVYGPGGTQTCTATATQQFSNVLNTVSTTTATSSSATSGSTATTSKPVDGFTVTPPGGHAPLAIVFNGTVNANASCTGSTYTFAYGEGAASPIMVPAKACKVQTFKLTHTYRKNGRYTTQLFKGSQLLQSTLITISATSSSATSTQSAAVGAALITLNFRLIAVLEQLLDALTHL